MSEFDEWLAALGDEAKAAKLTEVFGWIERTFPQLERAVKWKQPMYTNEGTFIIGFGPYAKYFAVSPEAYTLEKFLPEIEQAGYTSTVNFIRIPWGGDVDLGLLEKLIDFNIADKAGYAKFWRDAG